MTITRLPPAILLPCLAFCLGGRSSSASAAPPNLPNFHTVAPGIYRSAAPTEEGLQQLWAKGIHTIVDLRISPRQVRQEKALAQRLGVTWLIMLMGSDPPTGHQVSTLLAALKRAP